MNTVDITSEKVLTFINKHKDIDFDKILDKIIDMIEQLELPEINEDNIKEIMDYIVIKYKLYNILVETFPSHDVIETKNIESCCDYMLRKDGEKDILVENKYYKNNVKQEGVDKFLKDVKKNRCHGIMLSQTSGIVNKNNFQVDIEDDIIVIYLHNVNFDPALITLGFNIIKILENKIINLKSDGIRIDNILLKEMYDEYNNFVCENRNMLNDLEIYYKNTKKRLEITKLDKLTSLLNKSFLEVKNEGLLCNVCNKLYFKNKRALAQHKLSCIKNKVNIKINSSSDNSSISEEV